MLTNEFFLSLENFNQESSKLCLLSPGVVCEKGFQELGSLGHILPSFMLVKAKVRLPCFRVVKLCSEFLLPYLWKRAKSRNSEGVASGPERKDNIIFTHRHIPDTYRSLGAFVGWMRGSDLTTHPLGLKWVKPLHSRATGTEHTAASKRDGRPIVNIWDFRFLPPLNQRVPPELCGGRVGKS